MKLIGLKKYYICRDDEGQKRWIRSLNLNLLKKGREKR